MKLLAVLFVLATSTSMLGGQGCGTDIKDKGPGEPCTNTNECAEGLRCVGGVCDGRDASTTVDGG